MIVFILFFWVRFKWIIFNWVHLVFMWWVNDGKRNKIFFWMFLIVNDLLLWNRFCLIQLRLSWFLLWNRFGLMLIEVELKKLELVCQSHLFISIEIICFLKIYLLFNRILIERPKKNSNWCIFWYLKMYEQIQNQISKSHK